MKIIPNTQAVCYNGKSVIGRGLSTEMKKNIRNFDEIVIHKNEAIPEGRFINELRSRVMKDVQTPSSEKNIEEIKLQVENGSYDVGIDEIARRMLLS